MGIEVPSVGIHSTTQATVARFLQRRAQKAAKQTEPSARKPKPKNGPDPEHSSPVADRVEKEDGAVDTGKTPHAPDAHKKLGAGRKEQSKGGGARGGDSEEEIARASRAYIEKQDALREEVISQYDFICDAHARGPGQSVLTRRDIEIVSKAAHFLQGNDDQVVNLFKFCHPQAEWAIPDSEIAKWVPREFEHPRSLDPALFNYDIDSDTFVKNEIRYLPNYSFREATECALNAKALRASVRDGTKRQQSDMFVRIGTARMVCSETDQARMGSIAMELASVMFSKQSMSEKQISLLSGAPGVDGPRKTGASLVAMQVARYLLRNMPVMPFHTGTNLTTHKGDVDCSTLLPCVLVALCEMSAMELMGVLTHDAAVLNCRWLLDKTRVSLFQAVLDGRKALRALGPMLYESIPDFDVIVRDSLGIPVTTNKTLNFVDYQADERRAAAAVIIGTMPPLDKEIWSWINAHNVGTGADRTRRINWLLTLIDCMTTSYLFLKSSIRLEYEKSAQAFINNVIPEPKLLTTLVDEAGAAIAYEHDWLADNMPQMVKDIREEFDRNHRAKAVEYVNSLDLNRELARLATTKSMGWKTEDPSLPAQFQALTNVRLVELAHFRERYTNEAEFMRIVRMGGTCAFRNQKDRRMRGVKGLTTEKNTPETLMLHVFDAVKKGNDHIATGRQTGDIRTFALQMHASSGQHGVCDSSDLSAHDARQLKPQQDSVRTMCMEAYVDHPGPSFCWADRKERIYARAGEHVPRMISAPVWLWAKARVEEYPQRYIMKEPYYQGKREYMLNDNIFASGSYFTTGMHTLTTTLSMATRIRRFNQQREEAGKSIIAADYVGLGDDFFTLLRGDETAITEFRLMTEREMKEMNYVLEAVASRIYATFLQGDAFAGTFRAKPHRTGIFSEERRDIRTRPRDKIVANIHELLRLQAQRTPCPANARGLLMSCWNLLRVSSYRYGVTEIPRVQALLKKGTFAADIQHSRALKRITLTTPYLTACTGIFSLPAPPLSIGGMVTPGTSVTVPFGDISWVLLAQALMEPDDYSVSSNFKRSDAPTQLSDMWRSPSSRILAEVLDWSGVARGAMITSFSRSQRLSDVRREGIGEFHISRMVRFYKSHLYQDRMMRSMRAENAFIAKGVGYPKGLAYHRQPERRVEDAIVSRAEKDAEIEYVDGRFIAHLLRAKGGLPTPVVDAIDAFAFRLIPEDDSPAPPSADHVNQGGIPTLLGYHMGDPFGITFKRVGGAANGAMLKYRDYRTLETSLDGIGDTSEVLEAAARIYSAFGRERAQAIPLLMDYFAIPPRLLPTFEAAVKKMRGGMSLTPYRSWLPPPLYMDIGTGAGWITESLSPKQHTVRGIGNSVYAYVSGHSPQIRDMVMALAEHMGEHNPKFLVQVHPYSAALYTVSRKAKSARMPALRKLGNGETA